MVELYRQGLSMEKIARMVHRANCTVREVLVKEGVFDRNRVVNKPSVKKTQWKPEESYDDYENRAAIRTSDVLDIRKKVKVGDTLIIRTMKADNENGHDVETSQKNQYGAVRRVMVVDTSHPRFCIVEIRNGVRECILWRDIILTQKNGKVCIS